MGISQSSAMATDSTKAKDSAISIFSLLDRKSEIDSSSNEGLTINEVKGNIDFQHVSFKYPTRPDIQIFSDFTLHIPSGKVSILPYPRQIFISSTAMYLAINFYYGFI
jgi:ATP-binding cassette subfamily B (MDR/TAP) protein 1